MACEAGQLRPELGLGTLAEDTGWGHWAGPRAAGTAGPHQGRGSACASGALEPMDPTEPTFLPDPH